MSEIQDAINKIENMSLDIQNEVSTIETAFEKRQEEIVSACASIRDLAQSISSFTSDGSIDSYALDIIDIVDKIS